MGQLSLPVLRPTLAKSVVLIEKMQRDFLEDGGFGSLLGNDVKAARQIIPNVKLLLESARAAGVEVIFTKEGHRADLADLSESKKRRTLEATGGKYTIGDQGPLGRILVDGDPSNDIVPDLAPLQTEKVLVSASQGVFGNGLHEYCWSKGLTHIILAGLATEVGVQLVMRELNDRGFHLCLLADATASYFPRYRDASLDMIVAQGGIIGWTATLQAMCRAMAAPLLQQVERSAVVVIDMQRDFIVAGGFGSTLGNKVELLQAIVPNVAKLLARCREHGVQVIHTLEAHLPDLSDCPEAKLTRGNLPEGLRIGDKGDMGRILVRHEWGNGIVDENAPIAGEKAIFKPGKGAFFGTDLHHYLLEKEITHLFFAGVTTEVCVQTTMREANDRGFESLVITDCTESYTPSFKSSTLDMLTAQGAIVGWSASLEELKTALETAK